MDKSEAMLVNGSLLSPRSFVNLLRVLWVALAVVMGLAISSAGHQHPSAVGFVSATGWWLMVAVVVLALVVPSAAGLTAVRMLVPATVPVAVACLVLDAAAGWGIAALALSLLATFVAMAGEVGEAMVTGSAYGKERRFPLRPPATVLAPVGVSWVVWCGVLLSAALLLGDRSWVGGVALAALAGALTWLLSRRYHQLSKRWLVLVPAGLVLHDTVLMGETLMVQHPNVALARLALADTDAADLTGPAGGHAIEVSVRDMVMAVFRSTREQPTGRAIHVQSFLVAPTRPGRALQAMSDAKLPVG
jgi:hypothetical protein